MQRLSWALYDLANTIFSMNVISLYLPLWVASNFHRGEIWYAVAYSASMLVVAALSPFFGALGQRVGQKRLLLIATTTAVIATAFIGRGSGAAAVLLVFAFANIGYQLGLVAYNALLPSVAEVEDRGRVSGFGVALGYVGSFAGMFTALPFASPEHFAKLPEGVEAIVAALSLSDPSAPGLHRENIFVPTAILYLIFAIPLFLFVREKHFDTPERRNLFADAKATLRTIVADRNLLRFFIATFLYMDAVHTTYIVMATYGRFAANLTDGEIVKVMSIAIATAVGGSFIYGWVTDRVRRRTSILIMLWNWLVALSLAIFARDFSTFLVVAIVAGFGLGAVEVVSRVALLSLIPVEESGKYFGFFNLTGKASSIVGPQLWALTLFLFEAAGVVKFRIAVALLLAMTIVAFFVMRSVEFAHESAPART